MNIYLLLSGILLICLCILHIVFGERNYFQKKEQRSIAGYVPYHQMSVVLLLQGLGSAYSAFYFNYILPVFILMMVTCGLVVFVAICIKETETETIKASAPQFILFGIVIILLILGIY
ncbi:hypothetical protein [Methanolobus profundi]|uniref:Uncharacterized protein n=1 Tax=Methanolobus profundi TaxID=487685 RepID=A0A1I4PPF7_9EURY|nr:hypothetical protein [Methanolobus profundi]SFM29648.1 hypothetical protein SAMN04488696_0808 [Methanolobus profundi]